MTKITSTIKLCEWPEQFKLVNDQNNEYNQVNDMNSEYNQALSVTKISFLDDQNDEYNWALSLTRTF